MDTQVEITRLEELAATLRRRQHVLNVQHAQYGEIAVPAHIVLELENIASELIRIQADLLRLRPNLVVDQSPYLGLQTFQEEDANRFYGREALVAEMVAKVEQAPFLAVLGPSGSGKSSVVRAGLIPALKRG